MIVREALPKDASQIIKFQLDMALETEGLKLDKTTVHQGVDAVFNNPSKGTYYVMENEGKVIASLLTTFEWSDWRNGTVLWIQSVFVTKDFRRNGVFSKMYAFIKNKVETDRSLKGIRLYVEQNNHRAQAVYEKLEMTSEHYNMYEWLKN